MADTENSPTADRREKKMTKFLGLGVEFWLIGIGVVTYYTVEGAPTTLAIGAGWIAVAGVYYRLGPHRRRNREATG